jgi:hypothetical protein
VPWFSSVNLLAGREVYPEFCFHGDGPVQAIDEALGARLRDDAVAGACAADLEVAAKRLGPRGRGRAAAQVLDRRARSRARWKIRERRP